jgi:hypothetical protein
MPLNLDQIALRLMFSTVTGEARYLCPQAMMR